MNRERILIAGGNAAGATAAAEVKRLLPSAEVIIFEKSPYISTGTCEFPYVISGELSSREETVFFNEQSFLEKKKVTVRCNTSLVAVNPQSKTITLAGADGSVFTEQFSSLILATGAAAVLPQDMPEQAENVFAVKHFTQLEKLDEYCKQNNVRNVIVIGSGYTGLEFADAFLHRGCNVTILEKNDALFSSGGNHLSARVKASAVSAGIQFETSSAKISYRVKNNRVIAVVTGSRVIEADLILSAAGIKPSVETAVQCGIKTGKFAGIVVNNRMQTNYSNIYACGDCVELPGMFLKPTGYFPNAKLARKGGYVAAGTIAGKRVFMPPVIGVTAFRFGGVFFSQCGLTDTQAKSLGYSFSVVSGSQKSKTKVPGKNAELSAEIIIQRPSGKILGASFAGLEETAGLIDLFSVLIKNGRTIEDILDAEFSYTPTLNTVVHILQQTLRNYK